MTKIRTHLYSTAKGDFDCPQQWKELLGQDVINGKYPYKIRLKELHINSQKFKSLCSQSDSFNRWYDSLNHKIISFRYGQEHGFQSLKKSPKPKVKKLAVKSQSRTLSNEENSPSVKASTDKFYRHDSRIEEFKSKILDLLKKSGLHYESTICIGKYKADFWIPSLSVAIRINDPSTDNQTYVGEGYTPTPFLYHQQFSDAYLRNEAKLFFLWTSNNTEKTLRILKSKLGLCKSNKVYARKLYVSEDRTGLREFMDKYHLHGFSPASMYFSLRDSSNNIHAMMSFRRTRDLETVELARLVIKGDEEVIGGSKKLLDTAIPRLKEQGFKQLLSFAYRDITPDPWNSVYARLGFTFVGFTQPGLFFYAAHDIRTPNGTFITEGVYSRQKFQTHKLERDFGWKNAHAGDLKSFGLYTLNDSGNLKFLLNLQDNGKNK